MNQFLKSHSDIEAWLQNMKISNYTLKPNINYGFTVEVVGNVDLSSSSLEAVPIKFNLIGGDLDCSNNLLTSLDFCPETVGGVFSCEHNALTSLEFSPPHILSSFYCTHNRLSSLEGGPQFVKKSFICHHNNLADLEFFPTTVGFIFNCHYNPQLGDTQSICAFSGVYAVHLSDLISKEKNNLQDNISMSNFNRTTHKI